MIVTGISAHRTGCAPRVRGNASRYRVRLHCPSGSWPYDLRTPARFTRTVTVEHISTVTEWIARAGGYSTVNLTVHGEYAGQWRLIYGKES